MAYNSLYYGRPLLASWEIFYYNVLQDNGGPELYGTVRARPGRLSALSVSHSESGLYVAFVWARGALNRKKRRFPARAGAWELLRGVPRARSHRHFALPLIHFIPDPLNIFGVSISEAPMRPDPR
jgi:hypothetical protein